MSLTVSNCPDCGLNLSIVGRVHRCIPRIASEKPAQSVPARAVDRRARWREANREHYNELQRGYMRRRREAGL